MMDVKVIEIPIVQVDQAHESPADKIAGFRPDHRGERDVGLENGPVLMDRQVADRRMVVEVREPVSRFGQGVLDAAQFLVLDLEFDLIGPELVDKSGDIVGRDLRKVVGGEFELSFRQFAEFGDSDRVGLVDTHCLPFRSETMTLSAINTLETQGP